MTMTREALAAELVRLAHEMAVRSRSDYVDDRADQIIALAAQVTALGPSIVERRSGQERRSVERKDEPMTDTRRRGGPRRVRDDNIALFPDRLTITSSAPPGMQVAHTFQLAWEFLNRYGAPIAVGVAPAFDSSDAGVATVGATGLITAVGAGTATVTLRKFGLVAQEQVTVLGSPVPDTLEVTPATASIAEGETVTLSAVLKASGTPLTGRTLTPASGDVGLATVGAMNPAADPVQTVVVTGVAAGGPVTITITDAASLVAGTCQVTVTPASAAVPFYTQDFPYAATGTPGSGSGPDLFSGGANLYLAGTRAGWFVAEDVNESLISLDLTEAGPFSATGQSMKYTHPDRTSQGPPVSPAQKGWCGDRTIGRAMRFRDPEAECWGEAYVKLSANWMDSVASCLGGVAGGSTPGVKFWFFNVLNPNITRFATYFSPTVVYMEFPCFQSPSGDHTGNQFFSHQPPGSIALRGRWLRHRVHFRNSRTFVLPAAPTRLWEGAFRAGSTTKVLELAAGHGAGGDGQYITITRANGEVTGARINTVAGAGGSAPSCTMSTNSLPSHLVPAAGDTYIIATEPVQSDGVAGHEWAETDGTILRHKVVTSILTCALDNNQRQYDPTPAQTIRGMQFCRNRNQGPVGVEDAVWWSDIRVFRDDPGWGW